jgi:hypothetical protein
VVRQETGIILYRSEISLELPLVFVVMLGLNVVGGNEKV